MHLVFVGIYQIYNKISGYCIGASGQKSDSAFAPSTERKGFLISESNYVNSISLYFTVGYVFFQRIMTGALMLIKIR